MNSTRFKKLAKKQAQQAYALRREDKALHKAKKKDKKVCRKGLTKDPSCAILIVSRGTRQNNKER